MNFYILFGFFLLAKEKEKLVEEMLRKYKVQIKEHEKHVSKNTSLALRDGVTYLRNEVIETRKDSDFFLWLMQFHDDDF